MPATHRYELGDIAPVEREAAAARLWAAGALGVWEPPGRLVAWFDAPRDLPDAIAGGTWSPEPDRDWQAEWKATIAPVTAGRFVVVPTWLADDHVAEPGQLALVLDPGRAFGSGHHATTTLCLEALDHLDRSGRLAGRTVADVGCGTGILALGAAMLGARAVGTDLDVDAVAVSRENATRLGHDVTFAAGSVAEATALVGGPAEVVVANLITDTVLALADALVAAVAPGGDLIVSGVTAGRAGRVTEALTMAGATMDPARERDGWVVLTGRRAGTPGGDDTLPSATLRS